MIVTVDAAITIANKDIVLIKRKKEPFADKLAFPGGHVEISDQSLKHACAREILEETGLAIPVRKLKLAAVLDKLHRDPRYDASLSVVYRVDLRNMDSLANLSAGSDAEEIFIRTIKSLTKDQMAFDHWEAVKVL